MDVCRLTGNFVSNLIQREEEFLRSPKGSISLSVSRFIPMYRTYYTGGKGRS